MCEQICWNAKANLCEACAPDLAEETAVAQAQAAKQEAINKAASTVSPAIEQPACAACGAKNQTGKFCAERGIAIAAKKRCNKCGTEVEGNPKFCPECGQKYA